MSKSEARPFIGFLTCTNCRKEVAGLKRNKSDKYYFDCPSCGRITPAYERGQEIILESATIFGDNTPPDNCPTWIAEQWLSMSRVWRNYEKAVEPFGGSHQVESHPLAKPEPEEIADQAGIDGPPPPPEPEPEPDHEPPAGDDVSDDDDDWFI